MLMRQYQETRSSLYRRNNEPGHHAAGDYQSRVRAIRSEASLHNCTQRPKLSSVTGLGIRLCAYAENKAAEIEERQRVDGV